MNFEQFVNHYEKYGKCPNDWLPRKNKLNEKQLKTRYRLSVVSENTHLEIKEDQSWELVKTIVDKRDNQRCKLISLLSPEQLRELKKNSGGLHHTIDHAHVLSRYERPDLKYETDNVILLNRFSHSMIDQGRDPITGVLIPQEVVDDWWRLLIGDNQYEKLLIKKIKYTRRTNG